MIYLDNHATTRCDPRVLDCMLPFFSEEYGNPASRHAAGAYALRAVEFARDQVSELIGAKDVELVFTSGATESNNLAIKGLVRSKGRPCHIITSAVEHPSVLDVARSLQTEGHDLTIVAVDSQGIVNPDAVRSAIRSDTVLVSVHYANSELGTVQSIREIGSVCNEHGVAFHTDGSQAVGKIPVSVTHDKVDLMSLTSHKMYGPKGAGALFVRSARGLRPKAEVDGGGHERGFRSGTLNVPAVVGFGAAAALCVAQREADALISARLRDTLLRELTARIEGIAVNGSLANRLPGNLNIRLDGIDAEALLAMLDDVAVSTGSACSSARMEPSHVLQAIGLSDDQVRSSIRFGIGRFTTDDDIEGAVERLVAAVGHLRQLRLTALR